MKVTMILACFALLAAFEGVMGSPVCNTVKQSDIEKHVNGASSGSFECYQAQIAYFCEKNLNSVPVGKFCVVDAAGKAVREPVNCLDAEDYRVKGMSHSSCGGVSNLQDAQFFGMDAAQQSGGFGSFMDGFDFSRKRK